MNDKELKKRLKLTRFVVEANTYEVQTLWEKFSTEAAQCPGIAMTAMHRYHWEQQNPGVSETIGELDGRPVCLHLFWNTINGIWIMFHDVTSQVSDSVMVDNWLKKNCYPKYDRGRIAHCDAQNFHHVLHYIDAKQKEGVTEKPCLPESPSGSDAK